jgi:Transcriptional regulator, AbiEi antitoxin/Protein of unknown function (DUF559)
MVAELAGRQWGVVARRQLLSAGVSSSTVGRMVRSGWLTPLHPGVYLVAGQPLTQPARWMAAVLAAGDGALLSHTSAATLWEIIEPIGGPTHVTVGAGRQRQRGIIFHRSRDLGSWRTVHKRIPVTAPSRTLLDLAAILSPRRLERALETVDRLGLLDQPELSRLCEASRGRKGTAQLRSLLAHHRPLPDTRSDLERRFLRFCREVGLPPPAVNVPLLGFEVDCLWPAERVAVELDSYEFHRSRVSFESDRRRDSRLQSAGYRVVRVTHRRLTNDAASMLAELRALLGRG